MVLTSAGVQFLVTAEGLSGPITACHIHNAAPGVNGPVVRALTADLRGNTAVGLWTAADAEPLTSTLIDELLKGNLYINFHTAANPGGEIRGQVVPSAGVHFCATLTGAQENPATGATATGTGSFTLTEEGLIYKITVTGLTGAITAAHIHTGTIGVNGPVIFAITPSFVGNTATGTVTLSAAQRRDLIAGGLYVNVHTAANPGGEMRGQIQLAGGFGFSASLKGGSEVPANATTGTATVSATLTPSGLLVNLTATGLTGAITAAHIHNAVAGVNGPVVRNLTSDLSGTTALTLWRFDDAEPFTPALVSELVNGDLYINLHTAANPGGEIRGQLTLNQPSGSPAATFTATMAGTQERPSVATGARGTGTFRLSPAGLAFNVTVDGLSGPITAAHFHNAAIGVNGAVVRTFTADFGGTNTASGVWTSADASPLTPALVTALMTGAVYVNVHTAANPGGEMRGQVLLASGPEFEARLTAQQETAAPVSSALATASLTLTNQGLAFAVTVDGLSGPITAAHFHQGAPGVNGGVVRAITEFSGNTALGVWKPTDASPLTAALITELLKGNLYMNLHTSANPGGEIRGQVRLAGGDGRDALLAPWNEVPSTSSSGLGSASMTLNDQGVVFRLSANDLTSAFTASYFQIAAAGENGPVVRTVTGDFTALTADGVWEPSDAQPLTTAFIGGLLQDVIYLNVGTANNSGGEIRGQSGARTLAGVDGPVVSGSFRLSNTPNPARERTSFSFFLAREAEVTIRLFDLGGRQIATVLSGSLGTGWHHASFATGRLKAGMYLYRLKVGSASQTRKMLIVH
jgi:Cu/Zn superoxide dismutase